MNNTDLTERMRMYRDGLLSHGEIMLDLLTAMVEVQGRLAEQEHHDGEARFTVS